MLPVTLLVSGNQCEPSSSALAILGSPWLSCHNPQIDWLTGSLIDWSVACHCRCLHSTLLPVLQSSNYPPAAADLSAVPELYHKISKVFSKQHAFSHPPYRPYGCVIDLLPGAPLPSSWLYNLLRLEQEVMKRNISELLASDGLKKKACIFTMRNTYNLVRIHQGDEWKMVFNTPMGHFE